MEHLEGRQSVLAALQARQRRIDVILLRHGIHTDPLQELLDLAESLGVPVRHVDSRELAQLTHGSSHGGIVAIASPKPRTSFEQLLKLIEPIDNPLLLLLEGVDDARNLGFTLRTAEAVGAAAVLIKKHLWDFDPVEIARPASGAYERLPLVQIAEIGPLAKLKRRGIRIIGCLAGAKRSAFKTDLSGGVMLCVGGEKRGLSAALRAICDRFVTIPTRGGPSSLSLSHAAAILLGEALRQRLKKESAATAEPDSTQIHPLPPPAGR
jgi:23S rRNA (guanosine2251-2'-O)-methyltransferase